MQKRLIIDTSKLIYSLWNDYTGELTQKQWIRKHMINHLVISKAKEKINAITELSECYHDNTDSYYQADGEKRELELKFVWRENCNINDWLNMIKSDIAIIDNMIWSNGLTSVRM
jgi:hypothetical protein